MAYTPLRHALPRSGWLALALSVILHALLLAGLQFLPANARRTERALPINTCVLLAPDEPAEPAAPSVTTQPGVTEPVAQEERLVSANVLPREPVAVDPGAVSTEVPGASTVATMTPSPEGSGAVGGGPGRRTGTTFFDVEAAASRIVYAIDRSASMGLTDSLATAKRELLVSLRQLPATASFQVIFYNRDADVLRIQGQTDLVPVTPENVSEAARLLERLRAGGSTDHLQALRRALTLQPDVLFLVTDAADLSLEQVRLVTQWNGGRTILHAIDLGGRDGSGGPLDLLARRNGGTYRWVPSTP
jgi:hypothetical protein